MNISEKSVALEASWKKGKNKTEQIVEGCKRLQAKQREGQCFTNTEIANECGVHGRAIEFIVRKALYKVGHRIIDSDRTFLEHVFAGKPMTEVRDQLNVLRNPYKTGRASVRPTIAKKKPAAVKCTMTMVEVTKRVAATREKMDMKHQIERDFTHVELPGLSGPKVSIPNQVRETPAKFDAFPDRLLVAQNVTAEEFRQAV